MPGEINAYGQLFEAATITPGIKKAAQRARDYGMLRIQSRSPVRTGALRAGWEMKLEGYGVRVTNNVPYTLYNEVGTKSMSARPMLAPTIPEMAEVFQKELAKEVGKKLGAKILGEFKNPNYKQPSDLQQGNNPTPGGLGFRANGKKAATLTYKEKSKYIKQQGKAFPSPPGQFQSAKFEAARNK